MDKKANNHYLNLRHYYGIPHCHTNYSTGKSSPTEAIEYSKKNKLDYIFITDHNNYLEDNTFFKNKVISKWRSLEKIIKGNHKKNKELIIIRGFEVTTTYGCDINLINSKSFFTGEISDYKALLLWLILTKESIGGFNHPNKKIFSLPYSKELNKYIRYVEVGNGIYPHKYKRYDEIYFSLLDRGWELGAINSQDNHKLNYGDSQNLTAVICSELDKKSIIKAYSELRIFSTESKTFTLYYYINDILMGGTLPYEENLMLNFNIICEDKENKIYSVEIISNGGKIIKSIDNLELHRVRYLFSIPSLVNNTYYVVRVYFDKKKEREALSSPIFVK
ncbi:CehA/McbA family metallohydrolase [Alloiococcus sp. CFN-8]|uniref:CehA/McbA family metallohydrolase n=1 Tax=Alloiococcus sp. CFN-8 TaxID=3416081 RepID=UPI003CF63BBE